MDSQRVELTTQPWEGYRLSRQQERLWSLRRRRGIQRIVAGAALDGPLDRLTLVAALEDLVERHEILRTSFRPIVGEDGAALMVIHPPAAPALDEVDLVGLTPDEQARTIADHVRAEQARSLDPTAADPIRFTLFSQARERHTLVLAAPRLCLDGPSTTSLFVKLAEAYAARAGGLAPPEGPIVQYSDFAQWQLDQGVPGDAGGASAQRRSARRETPPLRLPLELTTREEGTATLSWTAAAGALPAIAGLARRRDTTPGVALQACWGAALWCVGGRPESMLIEMRLPGRPFDELADALGSFESYAPVLLEVPSGATLESLIRAHADQIASLLADQDTLSPGPVRDCPLDPHRIGFTHMERPDRINAGPLTFSGTWSEAQTEPFKLELICETVADDLRLTLRYEENGFAREGVDAVAQAMRAVLDTAARAPATPVNDLVLLDAHAAARQIACWNPPAAPLARPACLHRAVSEQAARTPEAPALLYADRQWTYAELDRFTNRMARVLRARGVTRGSVVGLMLERSDLAIAAMIAILKAGGAYVPLDPGLPVHRRAVMVAQAAPALLVAEAAGAGDGSADLPRLLIDADRGTIDGEDDAPLDDIVDGGDLAYVLFTSGSTGAPKGVAIEHRQLMLYVDGAAARLALEAPARYVALGTLATDLGNTAIFTALCTGGSLDVIPASVSSDAHALATQLASRPYDVLKITPSHLAALFAVADAPSRLLPRRSLILGGEALSWGMLRLFRAFGEGCSIFNHYGPTETCIGVLAGEVASDAIPDLASTAPLGRPLRHARVYVLDLQGRPVPLGVAGELWIGGETVARGYLHQAEGTAEHFVADPWSDRAGARMYRSGDLVRQLPDGRLEFLGRLDRQVKVRGFRVELAEIEAALQQHDNVAASLVVEAGESEAAHLVAYVVASDGITGMAEWLRSHLQDRLPDYMIPAHFVALARFPLTAAGKIDASALPDPESIRASPGTVFVEPRTDTERRVATIFSDLLLGGRVGAGDDFFEIGGHSLLATRLLSRLRAVFPIDLGLRSVFENATVEGLSMEIDAQMARKVQA